jgi:hypothetical protein
MAIIEKLQIEVKFHKVEAQNLARDLRIANQVCVFCGLVVEIVVAFMVAFSSSTRKHRSLHDVVRFPVQQSA